MRSLSLRSATTLLALSPFGTLTGCFRTDVVGIDAPKPTPAKADLVAVIDRSGSMWGEIDNVKSGLSKLLGVHEVLGGGVDLTLSLISYSSHGDCIKHFERVPMDKATTDNTVASQIESIRSTGLTGMSQAVQMAKTLKQPGRVLYVVLMSDGYCNDPGVRSEQQGSQKAVDEIVTAGGIVSTLCYGGYADFAFLNGLATAGKGVCLRAGSAKEFYLAMETGARAAANLQAQAIVLKADGAEIVVCIDPRAKTVMSAVGGKDLVLTSLPSPDAKAYRFVKADSGHAGPASTSEESALAALLAARAMLDHGDVTRAKEFVIGSAAQDARKFWRALTSAEQRDLTGAIDAVLFGDDPITLDDTLSVIPPGASILDVFAVMEEFKPGTIQVHLPSLKSAYQRRTVPRVAGSLAADGTITPFRYSLEGDGSEWANVTGIVLSRTSPNASLQTMIPAYLKDEQTGEGVDKIGPVDLTDKLKMVRNYTIVGDGSVLTEKARFKVNDRRAREALSALGLQVNPETWEVEIDFSKMAVASKDPGDCLPSVTDVNRMLSAAALAKLLAAVKPEGESAEFDPATVVALKEHGLTPAMNFSPPTTTPYADRKKALADGVIDTRIGYEVFVGTPAMPQLMKDLYGGDEFLKRRFEAKLGGTDVAKEFMEGAIMLDGAVFSAKALTARTKLNEADAAAYAVNCGALGVPEAGAEAALLDALIFAYGDKAAAKAAADKIAECRTGKMDRATAIGEVDAIRRRIEAAISRFWAAHISPVVMYTGGTGAVPASIKAKSVELASINGSLPKAMKEEGVFFLTPGGLLITIVASQEDVPTAKTPRA